jgi:hypothetical protein
MGSFRKSSDKDKFHSKWVQKVIHAPVGPPQGLNELSKMVGKAKRFSSKDFRESQNRQEVRPTRRVISISTHTGAKKITKVVKKTYTTIV